MPESETQEGVAKVQRRIVRVEVNQLLAHAKRRADYRTRPETDVEKHCSYHDIVIATPGMRQAKANETSQTACDQGKSQKYRRDHHDCLTPATHQGRKAREVEYPACLLWL